MLYGYSRSPIALAVAAHKNVAQYEAWYAGLNTTEDKITSHRETDFMEHLTDPEFAGLNHAIYLFDFASAEDVAAFVTKHDISVQTNAYAKDRHNDMINYDAPDEYDVNETRTIEEIHGLTENDPWDHRSDEQKEADAKVKEMMKQMRKEGKLTDDSFSAPKKKDEGVDENGNKINSDVHVTDISASVNADGKVEIDRVLAVKDYSNLRDVLDKKPEADKE